MDSVPAVEREIATDLAKRGLWVAPAVLLVALALRGPAGAAGAGIALAIVLANFMLAAFSVSWAATISDKAVGIASLVGYVVRLGAIVVALFVLRHVTWSDLPALGTTLVAAHTGLLAWEARYVSMTLGAPGLRPKRPVAISGEE